jgi:hypothetical protein
VIGGAVSLEIEPANAAAKLWLVMARTSHVILDDE